MIYRFGQFELDSAKFELRRDGCALAAEPQVLSLLLLLAENRERLVSKDEIVEKVWNGRIVSDAAISSRVKSARQLLGDDGKRQQVIATVHGRGFRFVADAAPLRADAAADRAGDSDPEAAARPSIAVLPFALLGDGGPFGAIADALPHELIGELSRLRWLFVIARASSFRLRGGEGDLPRLGAALGARYCLSGMVEIAGGRLAVTVELADTGSSRAIWGERYTGDLDAVHEIRGGIVASVVSALELQIPLAEAQRARLQSPGSLDAWAAYHLGLDCMFRFNRADNAAAARHFEQALAKDPHFARAHAGLSFTHFQNAFLDYTHEFAAERDRARRRAEEALACDPLDPFVNQVMGRVHWLEGDAAGSLAWSERATRISPNYAQGVYLGGMAKVLSGDGAASEADLRLAMQLSPLDPLRYAMLATTALSFIVRDRGGEAQRWAEQGARLPGAHVHIDLVAAMANALAGDEAAARAWAERARKRQPGIGPEEFLRAFPFSGADQRARIAGALRQAGL